jgi:hypothetical protein
VNIHPTAPFTAMRGCRNGSSISFPGADHAVFLLAEDHASVSSGTDISHAPGLARRAAFPEAVNVTGTPQIALNVGGHIVNATYISGSGTTSLLFRYTVVAGDVDLDGITSSSPINLNGGTITDAAGNNALLTFTPPNTTGVIVAFPHAQFNASGETLTQNAASFILTVALSAAVNVTVSIPFTLGGSAVAGLDYSGVTASPLVIAASKTSATITGTILYSGPFGGPQSRTLIVTLQTPTNALLGTTSVNTLTISAITTRPSFPGLTAQERYIQALYEAELGRAGTLAELDGWVSLLNRSGPQAVVAAIHGSTEAKDNLVKSWYREFLGRSPGSGEEMGWVNMLLAGKTEESVLSQILGSTEFYQRAQTLVTSGTPQQRYIQELYQSLLHRTASDSEVAGWMGYLEGGQQVVAADFLSTPEFRSNIFTAYYETLLHRQPDAAGLANWVNSTLDIGAVQVIFETTTEFMTNG